MFGFLKKKHQPDKPTINPEDRRNDLGGAVFEVLHSQQTGIRLYARACVVYKYKGGVGVTWAETHTDAARITTFVKEVSAAAKRGSLTATFVVHGLASHPPFAQRMGLDFSRSYATEMKPFMVEFSGDELKKWVTTSEFRQATIKGIEVELTP